MWCGVFLLGQKTRWTFSKGKCDAEHFTKSNVMLNILQSQMYAKMHFCIKCIFAQLNIFQRKMFSKTKCTHQMHLMPKCILAYIWLCKMFSCAKKHLMLCKNIFLHHILLVLNIFLWKMWCWTFYFVKCTRCQNAFCRFLTFWFAKMHFCTNKM